MKKVHSLILYLFFICTISAYSQAKQNISSNETYVFDRATFTIYNASSKAVVESRTITDPATVTIADMFFQNLFRKVIINNGSLLYCMTADQKDYYVKNNLNLVATKTQTTPNDGKTQPALRSRLPLGRLEPYSISLNNSILTFSTTYLYGDSRYKYPLEGKLVLTMTKQK